MPEEFDRRRILVVDDEERMVRFIRMNLEHDGFLVAEAFNGKQAIDKLRDTPDLVLLDVMMPDIDGFEVLETIREVSSVPVIMLTAKGEENDRVRGLELGADDYITKPFSMPELAARIRSAVRRTSTPPVDTNAPIVIGDIELDPERRIVRKAGTDMRLTNKEFDLLHYLMSHSGVPLAHAKLLRAVWGAEYGQELEYLRVFMHQLRKKLEDDPSAPAYLLTEPHFGYRFREPADDNSVSNP